MTMTLSLLRALPNCGLRPFVAGLLIARSTAGLKASARRDGRGAPPWSSPWPTL